MPIRYVLIPSAGGTTSVTADLSDSYSIAAAVSADLADSYAIRASVSGDLSDSVAIRSAVASDLADSYDILASGTVTADLSDSYAIRAAVSSELDDSYSIGVVAEASLGVVGGDDVPLTKAQARELRRKQRKAEEDRRQRWAQDKHDDAALSDEIGRLYQRLQGATDEPVAEEVEIPQAVEAPREVILEAVKALPVPREDFSQVAAAIMRMVEQVRAHQEHQRRLMEEDELILLMVA